MTPSVTRESPGQSSSSTHPQTAARAERNLVKCTPCRDARKKCNFVEVVDTCVRCERNDIACGEKTINDRKRGPNKRSTNPVNALAPSTVNASSTQARNAETAGREARSMSPCSTVRNATLDQIAALGVKRSAVEADIATLDAQIADLQSQRAIKKTKIDGIDTQKDQLAAFLDGELGNLFAKPDAA